MNGIVAWLSENATFLSSMATLIMAFVWVFYAQLLYRDFTSRHHPRLMIHQAPDTGADSICLVINMGQRIINVAPIIAVGYTKSGGKQMVEITDYRNVSSDHFTEMELTKLLKQGPIGPGDYIHLGAFTGIAAELEKNAETAAAGDEALSMFERLDIRVVLFSGDGPSPIGAWRAFSVQKGDDSLKVRPLSPQTHQMTAFLQKRRVKKWLKEVFD